jgi:hypothetical protein
MNDWHASRPSWRIELKVNSGLIVLRYHHLKRLPQNNLFQKYFLLLPSFKPCALGQMTDTLINSTAPLPFKLLLFWPCFLSMSGTSLLSRFPLKSGIQWMFEHRYVQFFNVSCNQMLGFWMFTELLFGLDHALILRGEFYTHGNLWAFRLCG